MYDSKAPLAPQIQDVDVTVDHGGGRSTRKMADQARSVKLWQILGTGFDHFDVAYWRAKGIPVANTPGQFSGVGLTEIALMYILMLSRGWHEMQVNLRRRVRCEPVGQELEGRRLLMLGFGASGRELAHRAKGFGMRLSAIDGCARFPRKSGGSSAWKLSARPLTWTAGCRNATSSRSTSISTGHTPNR